MPTVTIASQDYAVYADTATANEYLAASVTATTWNDADTSDDDKAKALVSATRLLDRQKWLGSKTDADQALTWPRTDTGVDGVEDAVVPQAIIDACCELAALFVAGTTDAIDNASTSQQTRSLKAGTVAIEYFRPDANTAARFPTAVQELVGDYLAGNGSDVVAGYVGGTDVCSAFDDSYGLTRGL